MKFNVIKYIIIFVIFLIIGIAIEIFFWTSLSTRIYNSGVDKNAGDTDSRMDSNYESHYLLKSITTELNLLDAEIVAASWAQKASSVDIERVLHELAAGPAKDNRAQLATLIASVWASKDPDAAMKFVMTHNVDHQVAFEVGDTWACFRPDNAARWLRNQPDLTKAECAGIVCGLAKVHPEDALEFLSREGIMYYVDLELISSAALKVQPEYFADWTKSIFNENNRQEIMNAQIGHFCDLSSEKMASILSELPDSIFRKKYTIRIYNYHKKYGLKSKAEEILKFMPMDIVAEILPELLYFDHNNSDIKDMISDLPPENRQLAILHYIEHNFSTEDQYLEALSILVSEPAERNIILGMLKEIEVIETKNP